MSIISVRDNENKRWKKSRKKQKQTNKKSKKKQRRGASYSESVRAKWFCCAFRLGFIQLICKASFIFKSNLELALLIIVKERKLYQMKHAAVEYKCLNHETCYPFWYVP